ncbi:MAG: hypothetical protein QG629_854, partial [Patescibacteria group bacterium]|nr:hypothetical protein [Patescibacteria group bacterium]
MLVFFPGSFGAGAVYSDIVMNEQDQNTPMNAPASPPPLDPTAAAFT